MMQACPELLRTARTDAKLTQEQIACELTARLGRERPVHFTTISRMEGGDLPLRDIEVIEAWAGACGIGDFRSLIEGYEPEPDALTAYIRGIVEREVARALTKVAA